MSIFRGKSAETGSASTLLLAVSLLVCLCTNGVRAADSPVAGEWDTTFGKMQLSVVGKKVTGTYATDNGAIEGKLAGSSVKGYWIEDSAAERCATARNGRYYWGKIVIDFDAAYQGFSALWGYCDNQPDRGDWKGTRIR